MKRLNLRTARRAFLTPWTCTVDEGCAALDSIDHIESSVVAPLETAPFFVATVGPNVTSATLDPSVKP